MTSAKVADRYFRYNATVGPATLSTLLTAHCGRRDPPRTRQSLLILAAFRPWGGSQGERHTSGRRPIVRGPARPGRPPTLASTCLTRARLLPSGRFPDGPLALACKPARGQPVAVPNPAAPRVHRR